MKAAYQLLGALLTLFLSGCATAYMRSDLSGTQPNGLYPATKADFTGTYHYCSGNLDLFWSDATPSKPNLLEISFWVIFATIDLPISIVTDTLCLPWDLTKRKKEKSPQHSDTSNPHSPSAQGADGR